MSPQTPRTYAQIQLSSPDPIGTAAALSVLGFTARARHGSEIALRASNGDCELLVTDANEPSGSQRSIFYGLDIYSSNADLTFRVARASRWAATSPVAYWTGGRPILETRLSRAADGVTVFGAQTDPVLALPTSLDGDSKRLHSDVVTAVYFVEQEDVSNEVTFWTEHVGLVLFEEPAWYDKEPMVALFDLAVPRRIGGVLFTDADGRRLIELLYLEGGGLPESPNHLSGLRSLTFPGPGPAGVQHSPTGIAFNYAAQIEENA